MNGMGIAWLPREFVAEELAAKTLLDLSPEPGVVDLQVLVYRNHGCRWKLHASWIEAREPAR